MEPLVSDTIKNSRQAHYGATYENEKNLYIITCKYLMKTNHKSYQISPRAAESVEHKHSRGLFFGSTRSHAGFP